MRPADQPLAMADGQMSIATVLGGDSTDTTQWNRWWLVVGRGRRMNLD
jgi:hypothetical protein